MLIMIQVHCGIEEYALGRKRKVDFTKSAYEGVYSFVPSTRVELSLMGAQDYIYDLDKSRWEEVM